MRKGFGSFITGRSEEVRFEVDMRHVGKSLYLPPTKEYLSLQTINCREAISG